MAKKLVLPPIGLFPWYEYDDEPEFDLGAVWSHLYEYDDGRLILGQETEPRFNVPIVKGDDGKLHLDRANVEWIDGVLLQEERDRLLDQYDDPVSLQSMYNGLQPANPDFVV